jgi:hypothetical protein
MTRPSARWVARTAAATGPKQQNKVRHRPQLQHTTNNGHNAHIAPLSHCHRHIIHVLIQFPIILRSYCRWLRVTHQTTNDRAAFKKSKLK